MVLVDAKIQRKRKRPKKCGEKFAWKRENNYLCRKELKKTYMAETVCTYKKRQKHTPMPIRTQRHTSDDNSLTVDYDFGDTDFGYAKSVEELNVALDHADAVRNDSSHWRTFPEFVKDFKQEHKGWFE